MGTRRQESKMEDSPKKEDGHAAIEGVAWKESMILNPDKHDRLQQCILAEKTAESNKEQERTKESYPQQ